MATEVVRSARAFARLQRAARDAQKAARQLERVAEFDVYGRYVVHPDEQLDQDELAEFLEIARGLYPGATLEVVVIAHTRAETEE